MIEEIEEPRSGQKPHIKRASDLITPRQLCEKELH